MDENLSLKKVIIMTAYMYVVLKWFTLGISKNLLDNRCMNLSGLVVISSDIDKSSLGLFSKMLNFSRHMVSKMIIFRTETIEG